MLRLVALVLVLLFPSLAAASSPPVDFEVFTLWDVGDKATSKEGITVELAIIEDGPLFGFTIRRPNKPEAFKSVTMAGPLGSEGDEWMAGGKVIGAKAAYFPKQNKHGLVVSVAPVRGKPLSFDKAADRLVKAASRKGELVEYDVWKANNRVELRGFLKGKDDPVRGSIGIFSHVESVDIEPGPNVRAQGRRVPLASVSVVTSASDEQATRAIALRSAALRACLQRLALPEGDKATIELTAKKGKITTTGWLLEQPDSEKNCFEAIASNALGSRLETVTYNVHYRIGEKRSKALAGGFDLLRQHGTARPVLLPTARAELIVVGSLDREIVRRVIRQHRKHVRECYKRGRKKNRELQGRLLLELLIDPQGNVKLARVPKSDLGEVVTECVTQSAKQWKFPKPKGGGVVRAEYPFVLVPIMAK